MAENNISGPYRFPFREDGKNRAWVRFRQINFEYDQNSGRMRSSGGDSVYMYLPGNITVGDQAEYGRVDLGFVGSAIETAIRGGGLGSGQAEARVTGALNAAGNTYSDFAEAGNQFFTGQEGVEPSLVTKVLQRFNQEDTPAGAAIQRGIRMTANPHTRALFKSVGMRTFQFDFEMMPDSRIEQQHADAIVKFFRSTLYPSYRGVNQNSGLDRDLDRNNAGFEELFEAEAQRLNWNFPSMLEVDMFYAIDRKDFEDFDEETLGDLENLGIIDTSNPVELDNEVLTRIGPKILPCQITSVNTVYDSNGAMAFRPGGSPLSTKLSVSVQEDRTLDKDLVLNRGY